MNVILSNYSRFHTLLFFKKIFTSYSYGIGRVLHWKWEVLLDIWCLLENVPPTLKFPLFSYIWKKTTHYCYSHQSRFSFVLLHGDNLLLISLTFVWWLHKILRTGWFLGIFLVYKALRPSFNLRLFTISKARMPNALRDNFQSLCLKGM